MSDQDDMRDKTAAKPRHPIGVVTSRTGIRADVLRAWERRYQAVVPQRAPKGRRLYSDLDIDRLLLLKRLLTAGRRIGDVAGLPTEELVSLAREDAGAAIRAPDPSGAVRGRSSAVFLAEMLEALEALDRIKLERILAEAAVDLSGSVLRQEVIIPLMKAVGDRWQDGRLRVAHEHLASALVRTHIGALQEGKSPPAGSPVIVLTTPAGQRHEIGSLLAAAVAVEAGWEALYLGPDLPAEDIAAAARGKAARAVALSIVFPADDPHLKQELVHLRRYLGPDVALIVGGRAMPGFADVLQQIGAICLPDLSSFLKELQALSG